jgi:hypothetical protein
MSFVGQRAAGLFIILLSFLDRSRPSSGIPDVFTHTYHSSNLETIYKHTATQSRNTAHYWMDGLVGISDWMALDILTTRAGQMNLKDWNCKYPH